MIRVKLLAGFAAFGALVSMLAGIVGGNPFAVILLRMLVSSLIFSGFGIGLHFVLKRYFPDLMAAPGRLQRAGGEEVDIVIDEDIPLEVESVLPGLDIPSADREPLSEAEEFEGGLPAEDLVEEAEEVLSDDLEEEAGPLLETDGVGEQPDYRSEDLPVAADLDELDALPDIDQLAFSGDVQPPAKSASGIRDAQMDQVVRNQDPADLAKAVRTFLKKDQ